MKRYIFFFIAYLSVAMLFANDIQLHSLKVNRLYNPKGIDQTPRFSWALASDKRAKLQSAFQIIVEDSARRVVWDSKKVASNRTSDIHYSGMVLASNCDYYWKLRVWDDKEKATPWSEYFSFSTAYMNESDWMAKWITMNNSSSDSITTFVPIFGRSFTLDRPVKRARAYASGLGVFDFLVNGRMVTESVLEPGETDYRKTVFYATYDITSSLKVGENTILSWVGGALYNNPPHARYAKFNRVYGPLQFIAQIEIEYMDGTLDRIITDEHWKWKPSATTFCNWYGGEDYDARLVTNDLYSSRNRLTGWSKVALSNAPVGKLKAQYYHPLEVTESWIAEKIVRVNDSILLVDFGQNFAGQFEFTLTAPAGHTITLHPAEQIQDQRVNQLEVGTPVWDSYTFRGDEKGETWGPRFVYHGFRYLEVRGVKELPPLNAFLAKRIRSAVPESGQFSCSDELLNETHKIICRAIESNLYNTLTDCPHREKLGWMEVPQLLFNSIAYNYDLSAWVGKIAQDTRDAQYDNGFVPNITPQHVSFDGGKDFWNNDPTWGGAAILVPYKSYLFYGDSEILREAYPTMQRLMNYYASRTEEGLLKIDCLGDWGAYDKSTSVGFTINCTYYALARAMSEIARTLNRTLDAKIYDELSVSIKDCINDCFFKDGVYDSGSQAAFAMALYYGVAPLDCRAALVKKLVELLQANDNHLTTGEVALMPLFVSLSQMGRQDVVMRTAMHTDMPGYGYFIMSGATSLPEFWDMAGSQNHCMMGHIEEWFYGWLAGIRNASPAFREVMIAPFFTPHLSTVSATTNPGSGKIVSSWKRTHGKIALEVEIPANCRASLLLPIDNAKIELDGVKLKRGNGVKKISSAMGFTKISLLSGSYSFLINDPLIESKALCE